MAFINEELLIPIISANINNTNNDGLMNLFFLLMSLVLIVDNSFYDPRDIIKRVINPYLYGNNW